MAIYFVKLFVTKYANIFYSVIYLYFSVTKKIQKVKREMKFGHFNFVRNVQNGSIGNPQKSPVLL